MATVFDKEKDPASSSVTPPTARVSTQAHRVSESEDILNKEHHQTFEDMIDDIILADGIPDLPFGRPPRNFSFRRLSLSDQYAQHDEDLVEDSPVDELLSRRLSLPEQPTAPSPSDHQMEYDEYVEHEDMVGHITELPFGKPPKGFSFRRLVTKGSD